MPDPLQKRSFSDRIILYDFILFACCAQRKEVVRVQKRSIRYECDPSLDHVEILIRAPEEDEAVRTLMEQLSDHSPDTFSVFDGLGSVKALAQNEIICATKEGKLVNITADSGSWYTRRSLQSLEAALDARRFVRISNHELVNLDKVLRYDFSASGTLRIELSNGTETWASRRCIPVIRKRLMEGV